MNIRRFRALHTAGATYAEIGRECGCDWRTVRKYLAEDSSSVPPTSPPRAGSQPQVITPLIGVVEAWLRLGKHVAPGFAVPLHPVAAAFADHYGFTIDVLAAYRPTGKGRVERQVLNVRDHVIAGRTFDSIGELDGAFEGWLPIRRAQVHRTHGQVIAVRAEVDRPATARCSSTSVRSSTCLAPFVAPDIR